MQGQFDWLLYLRVADHLLTQPGEAFMRSATSRAYYGVFGSLKGALERSGEHFSTEGNVHRQVIDKLKNNAHSDVVQLGQHLDRVRRERNRADYDSRERFDLIRAQKALQLARRIQAGISSVR